MLIKTEVLWLFDDEASPYVVAIHILPTTLHKCWWKAVTISWFLLTIAIPLHLSSNVPCVYSHGVTCNFQ